MVGSISLRQPPKLKPDLRLVNGGAYKCPWKNRSFEIIENKTPFLRNIVQKRGLAFFLNGVKVDYCFLLLN